MKLFQNLSTGLAGRNRLKLFLFKAQRAILFKGAELFEQF